MWGREGGEVDEWIFEYQRTEGTKFLKQLNSFETLATTHMETYLLTRLILTATWKREFNVLRQ